MNFGKYKIQHTRCTIFAWHSIYLLIFVFPFNKVCVHEKISVIGNAICLRSQTKIKLYSWNVLLLHEPL